MPDLPNTRQGHSQDGLTACGGTSCLFRDNFSLDCNDLDNCITLHNGTWELHTTSYIRGGLTSWALGDGRVVLIGGENSPNTTEIISPSSNDTAEGFKLEYHSW